MSKAFNYGVVVWFKDENVYGVIFVQTAATVILLILRTYICRSQFEFTHVLNFFCPFFWCDVRSFGTSVTFSPGMKFLNCLILNFKLFLVSALFEKDGRRPQYESRLSTCGNSGHKWRKINCYSYRLNSHFIAYAGIIFFSPCCSWQRMFKFVLTVSD